jgi:hypothetical protein
MQPSTSVRALLLRAIEAARTGRRLPAETILVPYRLEWRGST